MLGEYHYLFFQSDTLLLADVSEKFWNMCCEIYELDPARFLTTPELALRTTLKKTKPNVDLIKDINMLLMVEKGIRRGICNFKWVEETSKFNEDFIKKL